MKPTSKGDESNNKLSGTQHDLYNEPIADHLRKDDMKEFIEKYGKDQFARCFEDYVHCGEEFGYEAVDAFIEEFGISLFDSDHFHDSFLGMYESKAHYISEYVRKAFGADARPDFLVLDANGSVDLDATFDGLEDLCFLAPGFVFSSDF